MAGDADVKRILIVEDNEDVRHSLALLLADEGHAVHMEGNGQAALTYLRKHPETDLVLLDLSLPVMNGWQFRREQLEDPLIAGIPVAVLTGTAKDDPRGEDVFFTTYFPKPLHLRLLLDYISTVRRLDLSNLR